MEYTTVNLVTLLVGLAFLYNGYRLTKTGRERLVLFVFSAIIGLGLVIVALFPGIFEFIALLLGLEWKARAILVVSNLTLFVIISYLFSRLAEMYQHISRLNEEVSLLRTELENEREDD